MHSFTLQFSSSNFHTRWTYGHPIPNAHFWLPAGNIFFTSCKLQHVRKCSFFFWLMLFCSSYALKYHLTSNSMARENDSICKKFGGLQGCEISYPYTVNRGVKLGLDDRKEKFIPFIPCRLCNISLTNCSWSGRRFCFVI